MAVRRFSISFEEELADAVSTSAGNANEALSSWLAEAARRRVKQEALMRAVEDYELEFGVISQEDVSAAIKQLDAKASLKRPQQSVVRLDRVRCRRVGRSRQERPKNVGDHESSSTSRYNGLCAIYGDCSSLERFPATSTLSNCSPRSRGEPL
jgi:hypothetical protein